MQRLSLLYLGRKGAGPIYTIEFARALLNAPVVLLAAVSSNAENISDWRILENEYAGTGRFYLKEFKTYNNVREFVTRSLNWEVLHKIYAALIEFNPNFVISTMVHPWHSILCCFLKNKIKRIKIIHDVIPHKGENSLFYRLLNYTDIYWGDLWIVLSRNSKDLLINRGIHHSKIKVIPHANFSYYAFGKKQDEKHIHLNYKIAFLGRINKYKGLGILLEAFRTLKDQIPNLKLLVAGDGDCSAYESYFAIDSASLELKIRWISNDEIYSLLQQVDFVILPYLEASQSGVIPLAFALGKLVVATEVGGIPEQIPPNTGIIIPPNDVQALVHAILDLYNNPEKIFEMGNNAAEYAAKELSWDKSANSLLNFCQINI